MWEALLSRRTRIALLVILPGALIPACVTSPATRHSGATQASATPGAGALARASITAANASDAPVASADNPVISPVDEASVREVELKALVPPWRSIGQDSDGSVLIAPGGREQIVVDNASIAKLRGSSKKMEPNQVHEAASSFSPDGSALALVWRNGMVGGLTVLRVPGYEIVLREEGSYDPHWIAGSTLVFRRSAIPVLLDLKTGGARALGPELAGFGCTNVALLHFTQDVEATCPSRAWGHVLGIDRSSNRWVVETKRGSEITGTQLRAYDPTTGASHGLFDGGSAGVDFVLSHDGEFFCGTEHSPPWRVLCGALDRAALFEVGRGQSDGMRARLAFLRDSKVLVTGAGERPLRLVDLRSKTATALIFEDSRYVHDIEQTSQGRHAVARMRTRATGKWESADVWIDLETHRYFVEREKFLVLDPADGRHVYGRGTGLGLVIKGMPMPELYEVRLPLAP